MAADSADAAAAAVAGRAVFWRGSCVQLLYSTLLQRPLEQRCLCVRWLPGSEEVPGSGPAMERQRLLVGTGGEGGGGSAQCWLLLLSATLPAAAATPGQQESYPTVPPRLLVKQRICHGPHDVNRAAPMPRDAALVATTSDCGEAFLFRLPAQPRRPRPARRRGRQADGSGGAAMEVDCGGGGSQAGEEEEEEELEEEEEEEEEEEADGDRPVFAPDARLEGRASGGFGLAWDAAAGDRLLATGGAEGGGGGGVVCTWDVSRAGQGGARVPPADARPAGHGGAAANDVSCHPEASGPFVTAGDDGALRLHDTREAPGGGAGGGQLLFSCPAGDTLDCVDWEQRPGGLVAAGGGGGALYVVDPRRPGAAALMERRQHAGPVVQVEWAAAAPGVVASCGADGFVAVWDAAAVAAAAAGPAGAAGGAAAGPSGHAAAAPGGRRGRKSTVPQRMGGGGVGTAAAGGDAMRRHLRQAGGGADGAPRGLLFLHAGHSAAQGIAWNPQRPWMVASVGEAPLSGEPPVEESVVQVWSPLALSSGQG
ncbi:hypothetical protein Rsub_03920 [Raphidocelis subcapitata]|uniref:Uncharacterized protein n=1 Tax=Raphidocelis subcapitata TaxID=307507 RepID=A0A2V0NTV2_9CHLO|nr:hypothetical protein Rsub_03920 [Raphidocelis subcapitata]|eukprot:GBF91064.1 hypothetical protein Rsub_03920 [Raphidocelis subcapitata]